MTYDFMLQCKKSLASDATIIISKSGFKCFNDSSDNDTFLISSKDVWNLAYQFHVTLLKALLIITYLTHKGLLPTQIM